MYGYACREKHNICVLHVTTSEDELLFLSMTSQLFSINIKLLLVGKIN